MVRCGGRRRYLSTRDLQSHDTGPTVASIFGVATEENVYKRFINKWGG
jgi:hypothetical protein